MEANRSSLKLHVRFDRCYLKFQVMHRDGKSFINAATFLYIYKESCYLFKAKNTFCIYHCILFQYIEYLYLLMAYAYNIQVKSKKRHTRYTLFCFVSIV